MISEFFILPLHKHDGQKPKDNVPLSGVFWIIFVTLKFVLKCSTLCLNN
jgi:hypothetical protein